MSSQVDAIGQITGGPLVGAITWAVGFKMDCFFQQSC